MKLIEFLFKPQYGVLDFLVIFTIVQIASNANYFGMVSFIILGVVWWLITQKIWSNYNKKNVR